MNTALMFAYGVENDTSYSFVLDNNDNWNNKLRQIESISGKKVEYSVKEVNLIDISTTHNIAEKINGLPFVDSYSETSVISPPKVYKKNIINNSSVLPKAWDLQWDMKLVTHNGDSYSITEGSKNTTVAIIDSGIYKDHPDLKGNFIGGKNLVPYLGFDSKEKEETGDINDLDDDLGHGTLVAGQVAANGNIKGIAPGVSLKVYRVFGNSSAKSSWITKAIIEAANDDSDVINLSLGDYYLNNRSNKKIDNKTDIKAYKKAINYANSKGSVVVAAVGNDGLNVRNKLEMLNFYKDKKQTYDIKGKIIDVPADLPNVVTVSSTGPNNEKSIFSNYGENFVDITAPGGDYKLLNKYGEDFWNEQGMIQKEFILSTSINGYYDYQVGTSLAAPKVSGAIALVIDKYKYKDSPEKSISHIYKYGVVDRENSIIFGKGSLDIFSALKAHSE